jgi:hypothetical protein
MIHSKTALKISINILKFLKIIYVKNTSFFKFSPLLSLVIISCVVFEVVSFEVGEVGSL